MSDLFCQCLRKLWFHFRYKTPPELQWFPILNTQDEKNTADSPGIRAYSNKILSNFAKWFTFCLQMMSCYYKNISSWYHFLLVTFKFMLQFGFDSFLSCGDDWLWCFVFSVNAKDFWEPRQALTETAKSIIILFLLFWLQNNPQICANLTSWSISSING